jgi:hypothetical protein
MEVERLSAVAERTVDRPGVPATGALRLERSKDGSTYHIISSDRWKMFSSEEMAALVRMTREGDPETEIAARLHAWLARERRDALDDLEIAGPASPLMVDLVRLLRRSFHGPKV